MKQYFLIIFNVSEKNDMEKKQLILLPLHRPSPPDVMPASGDGSPREVFKKQWRSLNLKVKNLHPLKLRHLAKHSYSDGTPGYPLITKSLPG